MFSNTIKSKGLKKDSSEIFKPLEDCKVSKASNEIMLDRFCNGKEIEFPFSQ